jgi:hypothetical protein
MENRTFVKSIRILSLWAIFSLATLISLGSALATDALKVKDSSGNAKFVVRDDGSLLLNSAIWDGPTWAKIFISADSINGIAVDSHAENTACGSGAIFRFSRGTQSSKASVQDGDRLGFLVFGAYDGTAYYNSSGIASKIDGTVSTGYVPAKLTFETGTNGTRSERMVITSAGNIGIGMYNPSYLLHMSGGAYSDGTSWINASSREYKENISELSVKDANDALNGLNPVLFSYKIYKDQKHVGFIAEDVPDLVATKDRRGLSAMDIVAVLTKVVKEQNKTIEQMSASMDELRATVRKLESQIKQ